MSPATGPLRLMLLCTSLARGGAEMQVTQLALELRRRGCEVWVVSMRTPVAFVRELKDGGVEIRSLDMQPGKPGLKGLLRFLNLLREIRPQILHAHLFHANLLARFTRLICPVPVLLSTIHSLAESASGSGKIRLRDWLYRLTDALSDRTISVSEAVAVRHLESHAVSPRRSAVIPNGALPERFESSAEKRTRVREALGIHDEFAWLAAGRLMWKKDYATMLLAMAKQPAGMLFIAGEGPLGEELRVQAEAFGERVRFLGLREDVPDLMNACDGLVMSSVVEGLPMVLIEAALASLPAVATDVGGIREVIRDGETGFVVPVQDAEALGDAMRRVAAMPADARQRMGAIARRNAIDRFSLSEVAARWESLYRDCLLEAERYLLP